MVQPINRREFIKQTVLAATPTLVGLPNVKAKAHQQGKADTIVVVGAGMAGINAARMLQDAGFTVIVLEGRNRMGGRINTDDSLGVSIDLGAAWIQGTQGNPISKLAKQLNMTTMPTDYDAISIYDPTGRLLRTSEVEAMEAAYEEILEELYDGKEESAYEMASMKTALKAVLSYWDASDLTPTVWLGVRWELASAIALEQAADLNELSYMAWNEESEFPGPDVILPQGYHRMIAALAEGLDVRLNQTVEAITYDESEVTISTATETFTADRVVVTVPLGVLKKGVIQFDPPLPKPKQDAIYRLEMGTFNKVVLKFPTIFWPEEAHEVVQLSDKPEMELEFFSLVPYLDQPILIGMARGAYARFLEQISPEEVTAQAMTQLRRIFGSTIPEPTSTIVTGWSNDPFSYGSYSHVPPGASLDDYDTLATSVDNWLFFAGEATRTDYPATVHGAYLSGERVAKQILKLAKK